MSPDRRLFDSSNAPFEKDVAQEMLSILQQVAGTKLLDSTPGTHLKSPLQQCLGLL
jgi:hypothetical protein